MYCAHEVRTKTEHSPSTSWTHQKWERSTVIAPRLGLQNMSNVGWHVFLSEFTLSNHWTQIEVSDEQIVGACDPSKAHRNWREWDPLE